MHLLAGDVGRIEDGDAAVDLGQSPGDMIVLSAADSELALLAGVAGERTNGAPSLRLANLMRLAHPLSVDLYVEKTLAGAKLVVVRLMGGVGYWPYGLERLRELSRAGGPLLVVVPGEDCWDPGLESWSTVPVADGRRLWRCLVAGGRANGRAALAEMARLIGHPTDTPGPELVDAAGCYWPGEGSLPLDRAIQRLPRGLPVAPIVFYRSILQAGATAPIDALVAALAEVGIAALPIFVTSLKNGESRAFVEIAFSRISPAVVLNTSAFAVSPVGAANEGTILDAPGRPVLQVILAGSAEEAWRASARGLLPRDLTMNIVLPEVDGRLTTRAVSFKAETLDPATDSRLTTYWPVADRVAFVAAQAAAWVRLAVRPVSERRVAIVLSNYPNRDGRLANGVGLDTPESAARLASAMRLAGYEMPRFPETGAALMECLLAGRTNALTKPSPSSRRKPSSIDSSAERTETSLAESGIRWNDDTDNASTLSLERYAAFLAALPESIRAALSDRWGRPEDDPFFADGAFRLAVHRFGNVVVGIQPARGYNIDPKATYHDPDLVPPHHYLAFYAWLRRTYEADAIVHLGKHGNLEWLPGKALGLSETCWPEVVLGPTPLIYPFIVNDPGEGAQAKRRASAVIVDHLMPPMTRAEIHGPLAELETLIDEYYLAVGVDPRRRDWLEAEIIAAAERHGLDRDLGLTRDDAGGSLQTLDAHLCELKEMQIRDGLHILGSAPESRQRIDTLVAIARVPRSGKQSSDRSLHRAIAADLGLDGFDPLDCDLGARWHGPRPDSLGSLLGAPWRTAGDTVERIELLAAKLVADAVDRDSYPACWLQAGAVLDWIVGNLAPALDRSGQSETAAVLAALEGRFVVPGPSGAPSRGRPDVLPTGRNFYSVDVRAVPTAAAWALGRAAADALALRYFQDEGDWPRSVALSAWGTSNMRTGGDDIAQVLALIGAEPQWEQGTGRVTGFRVMSLSELGRPRIDVTLKISGMFRDAFPDQIDLIDSAMRAIAVLDESDEANPVAVAVRAVRERLAASGLDSALAERLAATRIFGAKPGAYGAGMQALIDEGIWENRADFAAAFLAWGGFAYGGGSHGDANRDLLAERLKAADAVLHNQDNREHDILDSDDYYQFQGGLAATVETLTGAPPPVYHGDHARPEKPVVRSLGEEIARVVRGRGANPKWIAGVMRHGYKGAFEMAATVDYLFAYAAMTNAVGDQHFDQLYEAYISDDTVRSFIAEANAPALAEMAVRFREAIDRGLWSPRLNSAYDRLSALIDQRREAAE
jgi:cobaltochelatase CobN